MSDNQTSGNKSRILFLLRYLQENTDDEHVISTNELISLFAQHGFKANRDTIRDDVSMLNEAGYEVISQRHGKGNAYHYGSRTFEWPEMRMLADAVSSSQFISPKKSRALIRKLASLTSKHMSRRLTSNIHTADWRKAGSDKIFLIIDAINEAIERHKKIFFQYVEYSPKREKILRHGGEVYINSPYALIWQEDRSYLVGYSDKHERVVSFRIDRMTIPKLLDEDAVKTPGFDAAEYANTSIRMYSGEERRVTLRCQNERMKNLVDRFGTKFDIEEDTEDTFIAHVTVQISPTFYGWLTQYGDSIGIVSPEDVKEGYRELLIKALGTTENRTT